MGIAERTEELVRRIRNLPDPEPVYQPWMPEQYFDIVFDGPPSMPAPRFVEAENSDGQSIRIGEWIDRGGGFWALRITPDSLSKALGLD